MPVFLDCNDELFSLFFFFADFINVCILLNIYSPSSVDIYY